MWGYGDRRPIKNRVPFFLCPLSLAHDRDGVEIMMCEADAHKKRKKRAIKSNNTNE